MSKPTLCLDFDGVIHRYDSGWQGTTNITDRATEGFFPWLFEAAEYFRVVVYSSRSKDPDAILAMQRWLQIEWYRERLRVQTDDPDSPLATAELPEIEFAAEKPAAFLTIDDRALTFTGDWADYDPIALRNFKPWNKG